MFLPVPETRLSLSRFCFLPQFWLFISRASAFVFFFSLLLLFPEVWSPIVWHFPSVHLLFTSSFPPQEIFRVDVATCLCHKQRTASSCEWGDDIKNKISTVGQDDTDVKCIELDDKPGFPHKKNNSLSFMACYCGDQVGVQHLYTLKSKQEQFFFLYSCCKGPSLQMWLILLVKLNTSSNIKQKSKCDGSRDTGGQAVVDCRLLAPKALFLSKLCVFWGRGEPH